MEYILNGKAFGDVATRLLDTRFDAGVLRPYTVVENGIVKGHFCNQGGKVIPVANATLRRDEWKEYDKAVIRATRTRLTVANEFISRGLTYNIPNGLGKTVLQWENLNDMNDASVGIDPRPTSAEDKAVYGIDYVPLPIIYKEFRVSIRHLEASRTTGEPLDTTMAEQAGRKVAEMVETLACVGSPAVTFGGGTLYGIRNYTNANTGSLTADWDDSAATGETMLADVLAMKQALINKGYYGPYGLFIPTNYDTAIDADFKAASDKSIRDRLMEVDGLEFITVADKMTADYAVMVQLTPDVMRMIIGLPITTVQWESRGGMEMNFMVMAIMVPNPRADQNSYSGIAVYN